MQSLFNTELKLDGTVLSEPLRKPQQMLAEQTYDGHASIHDDS